jgi:hypothetical protein
LCLLRFENYRMENTARDLLKLTKCENRNY